MINRAAIIIKYKQPAVDWINKADPYNSPNVTLEDANDESTVYLISQDDFDSLEQWLKLNFETLFCEELNGWYVDESLWPKKRTFSLFKKWFTVEANSVIHDTVDEPIFNEEI